VEPRTTRAVQPRLSFLSDTPFATVASAFNEAFADYYLHMGSHAETWLKSRCAKNAVDWDCSVGAFVDDRLVGFMLTGVDTWGSDLAAFDAATGIVPDYRGQGLARTMFEHARPLLRKRNVRRFLLEVLQINEPAIKAYRKTGFTVTRQFDCFQLDLGEARTPAVARPDGILIRPARREDVLGLADQLDWPPSWENSLSSIQRIPDTVLAFGAHSDHFLVGTIVYYPLLNWIVNLVVHRDFRRRGVGSRLLGHLLAHLPPRVQSVKLVNVQGDDRATIGFLEKAGFRRYVQQFEMEMEL
jgi:ribosomal protein S18 acetylase RimI-like enzyme